ncbi:MAG: VOC family protein [Opitutus sp.]|nr:VOC family protein [Opitutus sp.]
MKRILLFTFFSLFSVGIASEAKKESAAPDSKTMSTPSVSLGYVILYVKDVSASLAFYEKAFGLSKRFFHDDAGKAYGELETGATRLAFLSLELAKAGLKKAPITTSPSSAPLACEIALVTPDVPAIYARALKAGATAFAEPSQKPWGQFVAYVRDIDGHMVEICSPLP